MNDKNSFEDTNNKLATNDNIKAHIKDKQKLIQERFKSLLKTKKSIKNNIELIHSSLKTLPKEPQPKLIELIRSDTISNDAINIVWREIFDRERKTFKKIDVNKVKKLINVVNDKIVLLKTTAITNYIISDLKVKSGMDDVYNFNNIDKLSKINNDLDKYMNRLKREIGSVKTILKTVSTNQNDSHQTLMKLLN